MACHVQASRQGEAKIESKMKRRNRCAKGGMTKSGKMGLLRLSYIHDGRKHAEQYSWICRGSSVGKVR